MKKLLFITSVIAAASAQAAVIGLLIGYETFVTDKGLTAWKCTYNLSETNAGSARRTIVSSVMCPAKVLFN